MVQINKTKQKMSNTFNSTSLSSVDRSFRDEVSIQIKVLLRDHHSPNHKMEWWGKKREFGKRVKQVNNVS